MLGALGKHTAIFFLANMASKAATVLLVPVYTRHIAPEEMGVLAVLIALTGVVNTALTLGIPSALFMCYMNEPDETRKRQYLGHATWFMIAVSSLSGVVFLALQPALMSSTLSGASTSDYWIAFAYLWARNVSDIVLLLFRMKGRSGAFALFNLGSLFVSLASTVYLVVYADWGITGVLMGMLLGALLPLPLLFSLRADLALPIDRGMVKKLALLGAPIAVSSLMVWGTQSANRFFLDYFTTKSDIGLFDIAARFGTLNSAFVIIPFFQAWNYLMFEIRKQPDAPALFSKFFSLFACFNLGIAAVGVALTQPAGLLLLNPQYHSAMSVIVPLIIAGAMSGFHYFMIFGTAVNNVVIDHKSAFASTAVATIGNLVLIPRYGIAGAAYALVAANLAHSLATTYYSRRHYSFPIQWQHVLLALGVFGAVWAASPAMLQMNWRLNLVVAAAVACVFAAQALFIARSDFRRALDWWRGRRSMNEESSAPIAEAKT